MSANAAESAVLEATGRRGLEIRLLDRVTPFDDGRLGRLPLNQRSGDQRVREIAGDQENRTEKSLSNGRRCHGCILASDGRGGTLG